MNKLILYSCIRFQQNKQEKKKKKRQHNLGGSNLLYYSGKLTPLKKEGKSSLPLPKPEDVSYVFHNSTNEERQELTTSLTEDHHGLGENPIPDQSV